MHLCMDVNTSNQMAKAPTKHLMGMAMYENDSMDMSPTTKILVAKISQNYGKRVQ
jgi:hypothetical protein